MRNGFAEVTKVSSLGAEPDEYKWQLNRSNNANKDFELEIIIVCLEIELCMSADIYFYYLLVTV